MMKLILKDKNGNELIVMANGLSAIREQYVHESDKPSNAQILLTGQSEWVDVRETWPELKERLIPGSFMIHPGSRVYFKGHHVENNQQVEGLGVLWYFENNVATILNDYGINMLVNISKIIDLEDR